VGWNERLGSVGPLTSPRGNPGFQIASEFSLKVISRVPVIVREVLRDTTVHRSLFRLLLVNASSNHIPASSPPQTQQQFTTVLSRRSIPPVVLCRVEACSQSASVREGGQEEREIRRASRRREASQ